MNLDYFIKKFPSFNFPKKEKQNSEIIVKSSLELYTDWDKFPDPFENGKSFFSGRKELVDKLSSWIVDSNGGSVLVSGVRGVGKTAFVYHSIKVAKEKLKKKNFIFRLPLIGKKIKFIPINATSCINTQTENDEIKKLSLLKQIIKNYYDYTKDKEIKELYLQILGGGVETSEETKLFSLSFGLKLVFVISVALVFLIGGFTILNSFVGGQLIHYAPYLQGTQRVSYFLSVLSSLILYFKYQKQTKKSIELNYSNLGFVLYKFDEVLRKSKNINVFVIDEIDKLGDVHKVKVDDFIADLKNLLTVSYGRFIFIAGDSYFLEYIKDQDKDPYPPSSTFFNWRVFLPSTGPNEICDYLLSVLKPNQNDVFTLKEFAYYIYFRSMGTFSKVIEVIRDFIEYKNDVPLLLINEKRYDITKKRISRLTKLYTRVTSDYDGNLLSDQVTNHNRREITFYLFKKFVNQELSTNVDINSNLEVIVPRRQKNFDALNSFQQTFIKYEILDLFSEINSRAQEQPLTNTIPENSLTRFDFSLTLTQVIPRSDDLSEKRREMTETEKSLIKEIARADKILDEHQKSLMLPSKEKLISFIGEGKDAIFQAAKNLAESIDPAKYSSQEEVKKRQQEVFDIFSFLNTQKVKIMIQSVRDLLADEITEISEEEFIKEVGNLSSELNRILTNKTFLKRKNKILLFSELNKTQLLNTRNIGTVSENKKLVSKLKIVIFGEEKESNYPLFKNLSYVVYQQTDGLPKQFNALKNSLLSFLRLSASYLRDWVPVAQEARAPWKYDTYRLPVSKNETLSLVEFEVLPRAKYWRVGLAIGATESEIELSPGKNTFFHLFQETTFEGLKYRRFMKGTSDHVDNDINFKLGDRIKVNVMRNKINMKQLDVLVNNKLIDKINLSRDELTEALLLAWADAEELNLEVRNIRNVNSVS